MTTIRLGWDYTRYLRELTADTGVPSFRAQFMVRGQLVVWLPSGEVRFARTVDGWTNDEREQLVVTLC